MLNVENEEQEKEKRKSASKNLDMRCNFRLLIYLLDFLIASQLIINKVNPNFQS